MMQITFQNKPDDLKAFANYMAGQTEQGKRLGRQLYWPVQTANIAASSLLALLAAMGIENRSSGLLVLLVLLLLYNAGILLRSGFKPQYYLAQKAYLAQEKDLSPKGLEKLKLPRKLTADGEWLEISSSIGLRRCNWSCIEKIGLTLDFIFIHVSGCPIVNMPRRDFPSEDAFKEFGRNLTRLWQEHEVRNAAQANRQTSGVCRSCKESNPAGVLHRDDIIQSMGRSNPNMLPASLRVDRTAFSIASLYDASDEPAFWHSRTPQERLRQVEILRRINYGSRATERLQRILEVARR